MGNGKKPPVAVCTRCGKYSNNDSAINDQCSASAGNKRCTGTNRSALAPGDWKVCPTCDGGNKAEFIRCDVCQSSGYVFVRK